MHDKTRNSETTIATPVCPSCGSTMQLARIEPEQPGHDRRVFRCPQCDESLSEIVKYR